MGLMGDSSDNVPVVPSVGEKTAIKLLQEYGSIKGIYENLDKITRVKLKQNLEENKEMADLSRELVIRRLRLRPRRRRAALNLPRSWCRTRPMVKTVYVTSGGAAELVNEIQGMKFEILRELASTWYRSPGEVVPFSKLQRYSEGEDPRASGRGALALSDDHRRRAS